MLGLNVPSFWNRAVTVAPLDGGTPPPLGGGVSARLPFDPRAPIGEVTYKPAVVFTLAKPTAPVAPASSSGGAGTSCASCSHGGAAPSVSASVVAPNQAAPVSGGVPPVGQAVVSAVKSAVPPQWVLVLLAVVMLAYLARGKR